MGKQFEVPAWVSFWSSENDLARREVIDKEMRQALVGVTGTDTKERIILATEKSFDPGSRNKFDCYRAVMFVKGVIADLERPVGEAFYPTDQPTYQELVSQGVRREPPGFLDIAVIRSGEIGYHIGLVFNEIRRKIWSKMGNCRVDIVSEERFEEAGRGKVEYYKWP